MSVLTIDSLRAGYNGVPMLRDLDLEVGEGEVVALLGPNGAGKTTTLLTVAGVLRPLGGAVRFGDQDITGWRPHRIARLGLGTVPDDRSLFTSLTVRQNITLGQRRGRAQVDRVLEWFPTLGSLLNRRVSLLSGGEQQMLAIARAMISDPKLLLLDELSMGLAPLVVSSILRVLNTVARERGMSVLIVEQYVHLVLGVADRAYVLRQGEIVLTGPAQQLLKEVDLVERSYLGSSDGGPGPVRPRPAAGERTG
jgi:branched-chain amino acid transport system ATP-binding protein